AVKHPWNPPRPSRMDYIRSSASRHGHEVGALAQAQAKGRRPDPVPRALLAHRPEVERPAQPRVLHREHWDALDAPPDLPRVHLHEGLHRVAAPGEIARPGLADRPRAPDHDPAA